MINLTLPPSERLEALNERLDRLTVQSLDLPFNLVGLGRRDFVEIGAQLRAIAVECRRLENPPAPEPWWQRWFERTPSPPVACGLAIEDRLGRDRLIGGSAS